MTSAPTRALLLAMLLLGGCTARPRVYAPVPLASQRNLRVTPLFAVVGQEVEISYSLEGSNGCYRQSDTRTSLSGSVYTHRYTTWSSGGPLCTANMVPGGAEARIAPLSPGSYHGDVLRDDTRLAAYELRVFESRAEADRQALALLPRLSRWELVQLLRQAADVEAPALQEALNAVGTKLVAGGFEEEEREALSAWLRAPAAAHLASALAGSVAEGPRLAAPARPR